MPILLTNIIFEKNCQMTLLLNLKNVHLILEFVYLANTFPYNNQ